MVFPEVSSTECKSRCQLCLRYQSRDDINKFIITNLLLEERKYTMARQMVAIVTGAASGIGYGVAKKFAAEGAKVMMADVNEEKLKAAADELGQKYITGDLSKREVCKAVVDAAVAEYGTVNVVVNVAGPQNVCPIPDFPEDKWDFMISLMLTAPFLLTRYSWPYMADQGWGRIINISSIHGLVASEFKSAYVSAKHGLIGFTKTAGMEGGPLGITCNAICPAYVMTPLVEGQIADQAKVHGISEEEVISNIMLAKAAIKKMLDPATVADLVYFLTTDTAESITGAAIPIDGGWTAN
jgi:3-hydroxybutyrate dehydrogenase